MGKGFNNYMCKKFFHPGSKENIKRVWMAQQKAEFEKKKQEDLTSQYQKEQEMYAHRALLGDEKAKLGLSFMYDAPPGAKGSREKEDGEPEYKFEWQGKFKAPREAYVKNDDSIQDQPFGIEVRNVRCIKCHKWGHMNTDKICPLFKESLTAEPPQPKDNEVDLLRDLEEDGLRLKQVVMGRKNNPRARNQQMVDSDEDGDVESQFLKSLSDKQKKKLLKKIEKLNSKKSKKKKKKSKHSESDADSPPRRRHNSDSREQVHKHRKSEESHGPIRSRHRDTSPPSHKRGDSRKSYHPDKKHESNGRSRREHSRSRSSSHDRTRDMKRQKDLKQRRASSRSPHRDHSSKQRRSRSRSPVNHQHSKRDFPSSPDKFSHRKRRSGSSDSDRVRGKRSGGRDRDRSHSPKRRKH